MTGTWSGTLGAGLLAAALCVAPVRPVALTTQQAPPPQRPAGAAAPLPPLPVTQIDDRVPAAARLGQNFSLSFSGAQPIRDVLLLVLKDTGLSVVIDPDVTGTFTGELANVTLKQALDITLQPLGLQYTLADNVLRVSRRPTETRFFSVDHVATRRSSERTTEAAPGAAQPRDPGSGFSRTAAGARPAGVAGGVTSSDAADFYEEMTRTIGPMLSADGSFTIDRKAGLVRVTDYPDRLDRVSHYLELAELRVTRQVQIQATFVEVDLNDRASAGIDWSVVLRAAGDAVAAARPGEGRPALALTIRNLDGLLRAFATQGVVNVVATPRVVVMNNEPAIVRASAQQALRGISDAVVLTVTPQVSADRIVQMSVAPSLAGSLAVRGADTLVRVREGETIVIDGLMQAATRREPAKARGLAAVPVLGRLFGRPAKPGGARKTELVILLTPTIV